MFPQGGHSFCMGRLRPGSEDDRHACDGAVRHRLATGEQDNDPKLGRMLDRNACNPGRELTGNAIGLSDALLLSLQPAKRFTDRNPSRLE